MGTTTLPSPALLPPVTLLKSEDFPPLPSATTAATTGASQSTTTTAQRVLQKDVATAMSVVEARGDTNEGGSSSSDHDTSPLWTPAIVMQRATTTAIHKQGGGSKIPVSVPIDSIVHPSKWSLNRVPDSPNWSHFVESSPVLMPTPAMAPHSRLLESDTLWKRSPRISPALYPSRLFGGDASATNSPAFSASMGWGPSSSELTPSKTRKISTISSSHQTSTGSSPKVAPSLHSIHMKGEDEDVVVVVEIPVVPLELMPDHDDLDEDHPTTQPASSPASPAPMQPPESPHKLKESATLMSQPEAQPRSWFGKIFKNTGLRRATSMSKIFSKSKSITSSGQLQEPTTAPLSKSSLSRPLSLSVEAPPSSFTPTPETAHMTSRERKLQFKFLKNLGVGVQGTVSLRLHTPTNSIVALKAMHTMTSAIDPNVRHSFRREVAILKLVAVHPNVIRLLDSWEGKAKVYQVFDVATGGDFDRFLGNPAREDEAARLISPIVDAVRFLHDLGILHRDVRPANVFLRRPLTGKESLQELSTIPILADFGIATFEKFSGRLGTDFPEAPGHIAPEVVAGGRFTKKADCFGLGVVAIQVLLGRAALVSDQNPSTQPMNPYCLKLTDTAKEFVKALLHRVPEKRWTAHEALCSPWFDHWHVEVVGPVVENTPSPIV